LAWSVMKEIISNALESRREVQEAAVTKVNPVLRAALRRRAPRCG
jgi:hypothetical protein